MGYYFTDAWAIERTGKHRTTVMRWRRAQKFPPELVRLAELELDGELGHIDRRWFGFRLCRKRGTLVTAEPQGHEYTPAELLSLPWRLQQLRALEVERERSRLPAQRIGPKAVFVCPHCGYHGEAKLA